MNYRVSVFEKKILNKATQSPTKQYNIPSGPFFYPLSIANLLQPTGLYACRALCLECSFLGSLYVWLFLTTESLSSNIPLQRRLPCPPYSWEPTIPYVVYPIFLFFPVLVTIWKFVLNDVYLWLAGSSTRMRAPWGQGQWLPGFLKLLQTLISAWYLPGAWKPIWMNEGYPWGLQTQLPEGFTSQRMMLLAAPAHHPAQNEHVL